MFVFPTPVIGRAGGPDYAALLAAIPNKKLLYRADLSSAADGVALGSTSWANEGSLGGSANGTATWETNSQNGFRGVLADASGEQAATLKSVTELLGTGGERFTAFAVERRSGTQGAATGNGRYNNNVVLGGSDYWSLLFEGRRFYQYVYSSAGGGYNYQDSGFDFSDGVTYVVAWRMSAAGALRFNFNGAVASFATSFPAPDNPSQPIYLNRNTGSGTSRGYEYILTSDAMADGDMDAFVLALKAKWGIA